MHAPQALQKVHVLFNPRSGKGLRLPFFHHAFLGFSTIETSSTKPEKDGLEHILDALEKVGIHATGSKTSSASEATALARSCVERSYDLVIVAGGDGTINAVINGLAGSSTKLGILPIGTINLLGLQLGLPFQLNEACQRIATGEARCIDLGRVNNHYFVSLTGIGFDAFVIKTTDPNLKRFIGSIAYGLMTILSLFIYPFKYIYYKIDDNPAVEKGYFLIAGNVKYYGGKMVLLPEATLDDGFLNVCVLKRKGLLSFIAYLWGLRHGALEHYLDVSYIKCKKITILNKKEYIHLDGEYYGEESATIEVVPKNLWIIS